MSAKDRLSAACRDAIVVALIQKKFEEEKPQIDAILDENVERATALRDGIKACQTDREMAAFLREPSPRPSRLLGRPALHRQPSA